MSRYKALKEVTMRVFHIVGKTHVREWQIWIESDVQVHTRHGVAGGRMQHTFDIIKSVGKKDTKAFVPAPANAILEMQRKIRKKVESGYVEIKEGEQAEAHTTLSLDSLPKNLCFMKPRPQPKKGKQKDMLDQIIADEDRAIITIKRNGFMHPILVDTEGDVHIYTRRMDECTEKYPHLVESLVDNVPSQTVLLCEFVVVTDNTDDRLAIQGISNSLPKRARELQKDKKATAIILYIPFWDGSDMSDMSFGSALEFLEEQFGVKSRCPKYFEPIQIFYGSLSEAVVYTQKKRREGLVIYDAKASPGGMLYNFRGKPERPECWKWKPVLEDDFIVVFDPDGEATKMKWHKDARGGWGHGRRKNLPGRVALYQFNKRNDPVFISHCGSGFDEKSLQEVLDRRKVATANGVCGVAEIHYSERRYISRGDTSNSIIEPRFKQWRDDKCETECSNDLL
jgi:ATP-dependent DNA ligase